MDKYPIIIVLGAAILGRVGGEMMVTDPVIEKWFHPTVAMEYGVQIACAVGVIVVGKLLMKWKSSREISAEGVVREAEE